MMQRDRIFSKIFNSGFHRIALVSFLCLAFLLAKEGVALAQTGPDSCVRTAGVDQVTFVCSDATTGATNTFTIRSTETSSFIRFLTGATVSNSANNVSAIVVNNNSISADTYATLYNFADLTVEGGNSFGIRGSSTNGALNLYNFADISTSYSDAIHSTNSGGITNIVSVGTLTARGGYGIRASSNSGLVSVVSAGRLEVMNNAGTQGRSGIWVQTTSGDVVIDNDADITASGRTDGNIEARSRSGDIFLRSVGDLVNAENRNVLVETQSGHIDVYLEGSLQRTGGGGSSHAYLFSNTGDITLTNLATINSDSGTNNGIDVKSNDGKVTIRNYADLKVSGALAETFEISNRNGDVHLLTDAVVSSESANVIFANISGSGDLNFELDGTITSGGSNHSVIWASTGSGDIRITNRATVDNDVEAGQGIRLASSSGGGWVRNFGEIHAKGRKASALTFVSGRQPEGATANTPSYRLDNFGTIRSSAEEASPLIYAGHTSHGVNIFNRRTGIFQAKSAGEVAVQFNNTDGVRDAVDRDHQFFVSGVKFGNQLFNFGQISGTIKGSSHPDYVRNEFGSTLEAGNRRPERDSKMITDLGENDDYFVNLGDLIGTYTGGRNNDRFGLYAIGDHSEAVLDGGHSTSGGSNQVDLYGPGVNSLDLSKINNILITNLWNGSWKLFGENQATELVLASPGHLAVGGGETLTLAFKRRAPSESTDSGLVSFTLDEDYREASSTGDGATAIEFTRGQFTNFNNHLIHVDVPDGVTPVIGHTYRFATSEQWQNQNADQLIKDVLITDNSNAVDFSLEKVGNFINVEVIADTGNDQGCKAIDTVFYCAGQRTENIEVEATATVFNSIATINASHENGAVRFNSLDNEFTKEVVFSAAGEVRNNSLSGHGFEISKLKAERGLRVLSSSTLTVMGNSTADLLTAYSRASSGILVRNMEGWVKITNTGTISVTGVDTSGIAAYVNNDDADVVNYGQITVQEGGLGANGLAEGAGIFVKGEASSASEAGTIRITNHGRVAIDRGTAVEVEKEVGEVRIENHDRLQSGTASEESTQTIKVRFVDGASTSEPLKFVLNNRGTIQNLNGDTIKLNLENPLNEKVEVEIVNDQTAVIDAVNGRRSAPGYLFLVENEVVASPNLHYSILNEGRLSGRIKADVGTFNIQNLKEGTLDSGDLVDLAKSEFGRGDDKLVNFGTILGRFDFGEGDDSLTLDAQGRHLAADFLGGAGIADSILLDGYGERILNLDRARDFEKLTLQGGGRWWLKNQASVLDVTNKGADLIVGASSSSGPQLSVRRFTAGKNSITHFLLGNSKTQANIRTLSGLTFEQGARIQIIALAPLALNDRFVLAEDIGNRLDAKGIVYIKDNNDEFDFEVIEGDEGKLTVQVIADRNTDVDNRDAAPYCEPGEGCKDGVCVRGPGQGSDPDCFQTDGTCDKSNSNVDLDCLESDGSCDPSNAAIDPDCNADDVCDKSASANDPDCEAVNNVCVKSNYAKDPDCLDKDTVCERTKSATDPDCEDQDGTCVKSNYAKDLDCEDKNNACDRTKSATDPDCEDQDGTCVKSNSNVDLDCLESDGSCDPSNTAIDPDCNADNVCDKSAPANDPDCEVADSQCVKSNYAKDPDCEVADSQCVKSNFAMDPDCEDKNDDCVKSNFATDPDCADKNDACVKSNFATDPDCLNKDNFCDRSQSATDPDCENKDGNCDLDNQDKDLDCGSTTSGEYGFNKNINLKNLVEVLEKNPRGALIANTLNSLNTVKKKEEFLESLAPDYSGGLQEAVMANMHNQHQLIDQQFYGDFLNDNPQGQLPLRRVVRAPLPYDPRADFPYPLRDQPREVVTTERTFTETSPNRGLVRNVYNPAFTNRKRPSNALLTGIANKQRYLPPRGLRAPELGIRNGALARGDQGQPYFAPRTSGGAVFAQPRNGFQGNQVGVFTSRETTTRETFNNQAFARPHANSAFASQQPPELKNYKVFTSFGADYGKRGDVTDDTGSYKGYDSKSIGFAAGFVSSPTALPNVRFGGTGNFLTGLWGGDSASKSTEYQGFGGSVFGGMRFGKVMVLSSASYQRYSYEQERKIEALQQTAKSNFSGNQFFGRVGVNWHYPQGSFDLVLRGSGYYSMNTHEAYEEEGSGVNLAVEEHSNSAFGGTIGVTGSTKISLDTIIFRPSLRYDLVTALGDTTGEIKAQFADDSSNQAFTIKTAPSGTLEHRLGADLDVNADALLAKFGVNYQTSGSTKRTNLGFSLSAGVGF